MSRPYSDDLQARAVAEVEAGDIAVLDWLGSHRSPRIQQVIEAYGASLSYLPKCSRTKHVRLYILRVARYAGEAC
ncbi:hypothetical protein ASE02_17810 [Phenylobacterium sp. Root700]|nr:hypothetical protein ASE02_17810 [Phenylobacterium sp. Root700]